MLKISRTTGGARFSRPRNYKTGTAPAQPGNAGTVTAPLHHRYGNRRQHCPHPRKILRASRAHRPRFRLIFCAVGQCADQTTSEADTMSIIQRDYLDDYDRQRQPVPFPRALAAGIARKAEAMARRFEEQATEQLVRDAQRALRRGMTPERIARELGL